MALGDFQLSEAPSLSRTSLWVLALADARQPHDRTVAVFRTRSAALAEERRLNAEAIRAYGDPLSRPDIPLYYVCPADAGCLSTWTPQDGDAAG